MKKRFGKKSRKATRSFKLANTRPSRAYVGRFNFKGSDQQKLVRDLSGGNVTVFTWQVAQDWR